MAAIPDDYDASVFLDIKTIFDDQFLKEGFERLGILAALGPAAGPIRKQVDAMVLGAGGAGVLGVTQGKLDVPSLIGSLRPTGAPAEPDVYGEYRIWKVGLDLQFVTLRLALSLLDESTGIFAISFSGESTAIDGVKAALDTVDGKAPGLLSDQEISQLLGAVPPGFVVMVTKDCSAYGDHEGCTGLVASAMRVGDDAVVSWVHRFSSPSLAQAALSAIRAQASTLGGASEPPKIIEGFAEGSLVRIKARIGIGEALSALSAVFELGG